MLALMTPTELRVWRERMQPPLLPPAHPHSSFDFKDIYLLKTECFSIIRVPYQFSGLFVGALGSGVSRGLWSPPAMSPRAPI